MSTLPAPDRIATLDIVRGVAVMGILAMNIVAFAMPFQAYMNPRAFGTPDTADLVAWFAGFVLVDGKMRGLFSFLFGASLLLVVERAEAKGINAASAHYRRMAWLLVFGLLHYYFVWFGDILVGYALIGMIAFLFRGLSPRALVGWSLALLGVQLLLFSGFAAGAHAMAAEIAGGQADPQTLAQWQMLQQKFGPLSGQGLADKIGLFRGSWLGLAEQRLIHQAAAPFVGVQYFGWETLAYMLSGMAALKSGFLTGAWDTETYRRVALWGFGLTIPIYALLAWWLVRDGFTVPTLLSLAMAATVPLRPAMVVAYAALIILLTRDGGHWVDRIAAAGRAAFTNYLGTSLVMTTIFYGYGLDLYGAVGRAELWLFTLAGWALMLWWSKPWLDRFLYGPFEWLWRSLTWGKPQPMRRAEAA